MTDTTSQTETAVWPEGVLFRYLTVGSATVDVTLASPAVGSARALGHCTGCNTGVEKIYPDQSAAPEVQEGRVIAWAQEWSQDHAERCRAVPRPARAAST